MKVINRRTTDSFIVKKDFTCYSCGKRCWQQMYTGLHCVHSLLVVTETLAVCSDQVERETIREAAVGICNRNWFRSTYVDDRPPFQIPDTPTITCVQHQQDDVRAGLVRRFQEVSV